MRLFFAVALLLIVTCTYSTCVWFDAGISAHEGMDVPKNVGIVLAMCFSILAVIILVVNVIKFKCVKQSN